ncbi:hypothetical protein CON64_05305 [Bacillus pseudomycoides]|nr:hypothetical protein CON64_05305 [Bacillus pseudomycoides]
MKRDFTLKALKDEQLKLSVFSPKYFQKIYSIEKIIDQYIPGITVLSGNRGVGKSTIMNYYLNQYKDKSNYLFFKFNLTNNNNSFFRDIFTYIQEIDLEIKEIDTETKQKIKSRIESLKEKIFFNIVHEEISDKEYSLTKEFRDHSESSISIPFKFLGFKESISKSDSDKDIDRYKTKIIKTKNFYKDEVQNKLIEILNLISNYYKIFFIIDELDKMDNVSFNDFILENKILFLESDLSFFVIIDKEKCIDLQYNNSLMESLIREFIHLSNLEWSEFLIIASRMNTNISVNELREYFYKTRGNFRKLINLQLSNKNNHPTYKQTKLLKCFLLFEHFMNIPYINNLPILIKDFVKDFLYEVLDIFLLVGPISKNELDKISEKYNNNIILHSVITRVKSEIIKLEKFEEILVAETATLRDEIKKYHEPKELYYNSFNNKLNKYNIIKFDTPELQDWIYCIDAWIDSIDFVCICKQTRDPNVNPINYLSYHCNVFVSNSYIEPTIFVNNNGFAWIHEYGNRKNTLIDHLNDLGLFYLEIDLDENILNKDFFKKATNLMDLETKIKEKYDSKL